MKEKHEYKVPETWFEVKEEFLWVAHALSGHLLSLGSSECGAGSNHSTALPAHC